MRENSRTNIPRENRHWVPIERLLRRSNSAKKQKQTKNDRHHEKVTNLLSHDARERTMALTRIGTKGDNKKTIQ